MREIYIQIQTKGENGRETNTHRKRQRKRGRERASVCIFFKRNVIALLLSIEVLIKV